MRLIISNNAFIKIMTSKQLTRILTTPSKIASSLDWRKASGAILSLDIQKDRIGLAVASHPSFQEPTKELEPIAISRTLDENTLQRLAGIVEEERIIGFVVNWPVQKDTGKLGYSCGRVLNMLDQLVETADDASVVTSSRPVCLWDAEHVVPPTIDEWGRCSQFANTSNKALHVASKEQYHTTSNQAATQVLDDFLKVNWPTIHQQKFVYVQPGAQTRKQTSSSSAWKPSSSHRQRWEEDSLMEEREYAWGGWLKGAISQPSIRRFASILQSKKIDIDCK